MRYLENFNEIYQEYDRLIQHEVNFGKQNKKFYLSRFKRKKDAKYLFYF